MTNKFKYPRTAHLPFSRGIQTDDHTIRSMDAFRGQEIVVTVKMDGENTSLYRDACHARSMDSKDHPSRHWVKKWHGEIRDRIPENWRICGENVYARHSVQYSGLPSYFLGFSVWDDTNTCLSWDDTLYCFKEIGIHPVPVLFRGKYDLELLQILARKFNTEKNEGFVVRVSGQIAYNDFLTKVAKFVRENHVQTDLHWTKSWVPNGPLAQK